MPSFARSDFPKSKRWGRVGTVIDVALLTFRAHPDIERAEVLAATPRPGWFTVRVALVPPGDMDRAAWYMRQLFEEWLPTTTAYVIEALHEAPIDTQGQEQMTLG